MRKYIFPTLAFALSMAITTHSLAGVGVVSHIKVLSDKVEDVSSLETWKQAFIKPGMTDEQKALAVWRSVITFRHQDIPPNEFLDATGHVDDPIRNFNVYGYGQCCCASAQVEALARYIGMDARAWGIANHSVPEINIGGHWCMLDASLINYFKKPDGSIAGVEEISGDISGFYAQHPDLRNDDGKLRKFMSNGGWKNGPVIVAGGTGYDANGWLPAATHGWYSSMQEFGHAKQNFLYEYGSAVGYEVNIQLRPGEKLIRNWSNKGLHVNMLDGHAPGVLDGVVGKDQLRYSPALGDMSPGRIGNGTLEYDVPLTSVPDSALETENLSSRSQDSDGPAIHVNDASKPGTFVLRMPSSYVYLGGKLTMKPMVGVGGSVAVSFSDNNGLDWKTIGTFSSSGEQIIDLKPFVFRRYDYRLKFVMSGQGSGIDELKISHDIQHSQRALPALAKGDNPVHFSAGIQEGTVTVEGLTDETDQPKNLLFTAFHPQLRNVAAHNLQLTAGKGEILVPIEMSGDMTRLRIGCHYRARDARDGWAIAASFDGGKTFQSIGQLEGGHAGFSKYLVFDRVPSGSRSALVQFAGAQRNTTLIMDLRISADYREPHGGFTPVQVTYAWEEAGQAKQDTHVARHEAETYTIHCEEKPVMKSIAFELAQ
jgi:hypothetical protein